MGGGGVVWVWWEGAGSWGAIEPPSASALFTPQGDKKKFYFEIVLFLNVLDNEKNNNQVPLRYMNFNTVNIYYSLKKYM
jgi:hypothetical protein